MVPVPLSNVSVSMPAMEVWDLPSGCPVKSIVMTEGGVIGKLLQSGAAGSRVMRTDTAPPALTRSVIYGK